MTNRARPLIGWTRMLDPKPGRVALVEHGFTLALSSTNMSSSPSFQNKTAIAPRRVLHEGAAWPAGAELNRARTRKPRSRRSFGADRGDRRIEFRGRNWDADRAFGRPMGARADRLDPHARMG